MVMDVGLRDKVRRLVFGPLVLRNKVLYFARVTEMGT